MGEVSIRGNKVPLSKYFDESFISKFTFSIPTCFDNSSSHAILFTDIIGSSQIYHDQGDQYGLLIASQKYEIAQTLSHLDMFNGHIKIIKSMGDALFIVCENVKIAYFYTLKLINELKNNSEKTGIQIRIRSTLHYGKFLIYTPKFQNGVDCFGEVINATARLEGQNKRVINDILNKTADTDWNAYPLMLSDEFFSELIKDIQIEESHIIPEKVTIREWVNKEFIAYFIASLLEKTDF